MFFTKELNEIVVSYAKKNVLNTLFNKMCFGEYEIDLLAQNKLALNENLFRMAYYNGDLPPELKLEVMDFVECFLSQLNKKDLTALYFYIFNINYDRYLQDFEASDYDEEKETDFHEQFGRSLAFKIYNPEGTFLEGDLSEALYDLATMFASDFGNTESSDNSIEQALEIIDSYKNAKERVSLFV